jgi:hypothetical protein
LSDVSARIISGELGHESLTSQTADEP